MGFLDWLFGKREVLPKQDSTPKISDSKNTAIGNTEPICPYCNYRFDKMPQRKKKCPNCMKFFYSRTRPLDNKKVLIKENQIEELEQQWAIKNERSNGIKLGAPLDVRQREWKKIGILVESAKGEFKDEFKGVSDSNKQAIRRIISDGMVNEQNSGQIEKAIMEVNSSIGEKQANMIVRTETMRAVNQGSMNRYKKGGVERVEFLAVLDERTCEECSQLDGKVFYIDDAPDMPRHENCRCILIPTIENVTQKYDAHDK